MSLPDTLNEGGKEVAMQITESTFTNGDDVEVRVANSIDDYATAFRIAYEVYYPRGFTSFSEYGMRATPYQMRDTALVLLAYHGGKPVSTLSLYEGEAQELPSASGWPAELDGIGRQGIRAFELGALMSLPSAADAGGSRICLEMFRAAWRYARCLRNADALCAFVQAHHEPFYKRIFGFSRFGEARNYEWNGLKISDVVPLIMDLNGAEEDFRRRYSRYEEGARNLYRFFVLDRQKELADKLVAELKRRDEMDWARLQETFAPLLGREAVETDDATEEIEIPVGEREQAACAGAL